MSQVSLLDIFKYILAGTAAFIGTVTSILYLVETIRTKCKTFASTMKTFYILVILHQLTRLVLNCIPATVYRNIFQSGKLGLAAQTVLDLLPEILFFLQYTLILYSWIEIFYLSRSISRLRFEKQRWIQRPVTGIFITASITWTTVGIILVVIGTSPLVTDYITVSQIQGWFLFVITVVTTIFIVIVGIIMCCVYRRGAKFSKVILRSLIKTTILGIIYAVFLLLRAAWVLLISSLLRTMVKRGEISEDFFSCIWAGYMLVVEQIPIILVLIVLQTLAINPRVKKKLQEQEKYSDMEAEQRNSLVKKNKVDQMLDAYDEEMREYTPQHLYSPLQETLQIENSPEQDSSLASSPQSSSSFIKATQTPLEEVSHLESEIQVSIPQQRSSSVYIRQIDDTEFLEKAEEKLDVMEKQLNQSE